MNSRVQLPKGVNFFERGWLSSNNVLLDDGEQSVLIDTGYCLHAEQTEKLVQSIIGRRPLVEIINTHLHSDHCGGNAHLQKTYPNVKTLIPPGHFNEVTQWNTEALTYTPTGQQCPKFSAQNSLQSGDTFQAANLIWQIFSAPGHDPHSIILFCHSEGILISADGLWERGFGVIFPELEGISAFDEVEATLQLIESLEPRIVLPGHGNVFTDLNSAINFARARLDGFRNKPIKHSIYATKVLLKFKLLELQEIDLDQMCDWAYKTPYFHTLHSKFAHQSFTDWINEMCKSLVDTGAASRNGNLLINR
jgi:glyoxylase-like metal-dependent hydrolase (beta-lactamase superfamily II)